MKQKSFPGCCTARVLHDLGGTSLSMGKKDDWPEAKLKAWLESKVKTHKGDNCLVVITNNKQTVANKILKDLGFGSSGWMSKSQHSESRIKLWWKEP